MRRVVAGIVLTAAVAATALSMMLSVVGPADTPHASSTAAMHSAPDASVVTPKPFPTPHVSEDAVIGQSRNDAGMRLALEPTTDLRPRSRARPERPYANLTPNEARDKIRRQRDDPVWAPRAEARLEQRMASILGSAGDRSARIRCYEIDCVIDLYTATTYLENADLIFEISVMLNDMDADFSLFSEGPTDRRLTVIVEFPEHYLRRGITEMFPPLR
ncbi:MAG: hypothetical protein AAFS02_07710 [Pseudomonadota bacterium]